MKLSWYKILYLYSLHLALNPDSLNLRYPIKCDLRTRQINLRIKRSDLTLNVRYKYRTVVFIIAG